MIEETLIPKVGVITDVRKDTPDVKTFRVVGTDGKKLFKHMPGQCAMVSVPGVGECMFSITSSPTNEEYMEFSIKKCGCVTEVIHSLEVGAQITVRGPYGKNFPVEGEFKGKDLLFIAGGIGLAPLRSVINYVRHYRQNYGKVVIVYGARSKDDLVDINEIQTEWMNEDNIEVYLTIDRPQDGWDGHVGFVPAYVKELGLDPNMTAVLCGPPIMIKFTLAGLLELGFQKSNVFTTLELRMKCGVGKCGRCNVGDKFVCKDGPVFRMTERDELPDEYAADNSTGKYGKRISFRKTLTRAGKFDDHESDGIRGLSTRARLRLPKRFLRRLRNDLPYPRSARTQILPCLSTAGRRGQVRGDAAVLPACKASLRYGKNQTHATDHDAALSRNLFVYRL